MSNRKFILFISLCLLLPNSVLAATRSVYYVNADTKRKLKIKYQICYLYDNASIRRCRKLTTQLIEPNSSVKLDIDLFADAGTFVSVSSATIGDAYSHYGYGACGLGYIERYEWSMVFKFSQVAPNVNKVMCSTGFAK